MRGDGIVLGTGITNNEGAFADFDHEKYDGRLHGIIFDGDGAKRTRVRARGGVVEGAVANFANNSNAVHTIRGDDDSEDSTFTTSEVLLRAVEDQGVVSLDDRR